MPSSSINEQEKIINSFKKNFMKIIEINFDYKKSVNEFNSLLKESKNLIDNNLSEKLALYFHKKMENFISIKKLIIKEISILEYNLKQLDTNYIIYINKLVDNLKVFTLNQRNIYKQIESKSVINLLDKLLVNYYNSNKEIFKSLKQLHKFNNNTSTNKSKYDSNLMLNLNDNNNYININNSFNNLNIKKNNNNIINWNPKFKFVMNNYIKSKSQKKIKVNIYNHSRSRGLLIQNNFTTLFNDKIGDFIKKKNQIKNSSSPCLYNRHISLINKNYESNKSFLGTVTTMSDSKNNLDIFLLSHKIIEFLNGLKILEDNTMNINKNNINNEDLEKFKIDLEKKKMDLNNYANNIKNIEIQNSNNNAILMNEINNLKEKNSKLNKNIIDLINEKNIEQNNNLNLLYSNYEQFYEIYKLFNDDIVNNDLDKKEYLIDKTSLKEKKFNKQKIKEYNYNLYQKILEFIEIQKNSLNEYKQINLNINSVNSVNNNNMISNIKKFDFETIIAKINGIYEYLNNININNENNLNDNNIINIKKENNNLLSLSDELETPKSNKSEKSDKNILQNDLDENNENNCYNKILDLVEKIEKLMVIKKEELTKIKEEYLSLKSIVDKVETNLVNENCSINYNEGISFRNIKNN